NFFGPGEPARNSLLVCVAQEQFQCRPVRLDTVWKKLAEHLLHALRITCQPRYRVARDSRIENALKAVAPGFLECVIEIARRPGMRIKYGSPHRNDVHDRVDARLFIVTMLKDLIVGKQSHYIRMFLTK